MNRKKLERYLKEHGCSLYRKGSGHDIWWHPGTQRTSAIPRHKEVNTFTMRSICADLDVTPPKEK